MGLNVYSVNEKGVQMKFEDKTVTISGSIDCQEPGVFMSPFIEDTHNHILKNKMNEIDIDIIGLSFLNSSGIKAFVEWIIKLDDLAVDQQYTINFLCNYEHTWQELSMGTLVLLNSNLVKIEMTGNI